MARCIVWNTYLHIRSRVRIKICIPCKNLEESEFYSLTKLTKYIFQKHGFLTSTHIKKKKTMPTGPSENNLDTVVDEMAYYCFDPSSVLVNGQNKNCISMLLRTLTLFSPALFGGSWKHEEGLACRRR